MKTIEVKTTWDFDDLRNNCWSGAIDTLNIVYNYDKKKGNHNKKEKLMCLIEEEFFGEIPTMTQVNDFLWFEDEYIFDRLEVEEEGEE